MDDNQRFFDYSNPNLLPLLGLIFAVISIFFMGIVFVPLAAICMTLSTILALRKRTVEGAVLIVLGWVLTIIGFYTSPVLWLAVSLFSTGSKHHESSSSYTSTYSTPAPKQKQEEPLASPMERCERMASLYPEREPTKECLKLFGAE